VTFVDLNKQPNPGPSMSGVPTIAVRPP
jgi:hypothetical protein